MAKLKLFGTSKTETTEASGKKERISKQKEKKMKPKKQKKEIDYILSNDSNQLVFEPDKELLNFDLFLPQITVVSASESTHSVITNLEKLAKEHSFLKLIAINHLSSNNSQFRYQDPVITVNSECYDLGNPLSKGYEKFYSDLNLELAKSRLIIVVGEEGLNGYKNNRMPLIEFGETPVLHFINGYTDHFLDFDNQGRNLIVFSTLLIYHLLGIDSDWSFTDDEGCLNNIYFHLIKFFVEFIRTQIERNRMTRSSTVLKVRNFACTYGLAIKACFEESVKLELNGPV